MAYYKESSRDRRERIKLWLEGLDKNKLVYVAVKCIEDLIYSESVRFPLDSKAPYWEHTGDNLDGSEPEPEEN